MNTKNPDAPPHIKSYREILEVPDGYTTIEPHLAAFHACLGSSGSASARAKDAKALLALAFAAGPEAIEELAEVVRQTHVFKGRRVRRNAEAAAASAQHLANALEVALYDAMRLPEADLGDDDSLHRALERVARCAMSGDASAVLSNVVDACFGGELPPPECGKVAELLSDAVRELVNAAPPAECFEAQEACLVELRAMCSGLISAPVLDEPTNTRPTGTVDAVDRQDQCETAAREAGWLLASSARGKDAEALRQLCDEDAAAWLDLEKVASSAPVKRLVSLIVRARQLRDSRGAKVLRVSLGKVRLGDDMAREPQ